MQISEQTYRTVHEPGCDVLLTLPTMVVFLGAVIILYIKNK